MFGARYIRSGTSATAGARLCPSGCSMPPINKMWPRYLSAVWRFWIGDRLSRRRRAPEDAAAIPFVLLYNQAKAPEVVSG
jgi:hypothetical protein